MANTDDIELERDAPDGVKRSQVAMGQEEVSEAEQTKTGGRWSKLVQFLETHGDVELRGSAPVPYEDRTETNYLNIFTLWFSMSTNPLP